jgi:predicted nucleotidyltransferase
MLQNYNRWRVLAVFFDDPEAGLQLRELGRKTNLAPTSVKIHLDALSKSGLVTAAARSEQGYPIYAANRTGERFRFFKKINTVVALNECGLLDYLSDSCMPDTIVLFGSASRGEDTKDSDLDIFLGCPEKELVLGRFEKILKRKISLFFGGNFDKLSKELKNNIINGALLRGYLRVF